MGAGNPRRASRFLSNAWYVAAWTEEVEAGKLLARTILGAQLVLFRDEQGRAVALENRCPHRFAPLSRGQWIAGQVRCIYHGLTFDGSGRCAHNPHDVDQQARQPSVAAFPVEERQGMIWIWMGAKHLAQRDCVPQFDELDPEHNHVSHGYLHGAAYYELMTDNILDLSHIEFLHPVLGTEAVSKAEVETRAEGERVITTRRMVGEILSPALAKVYQTNEQSVNRSLEVVWHSPSNLVLTVTVEPSDPSQNWRTGSQSLHLYTPETENTTHYFYAGSLRKSQTDEATASLFFDSLTRIFTEEDKPIIDAQQQMIGSRDIMEMHPALLKIDRATVMARRTLARKIIAESQATDEVEG